MGTASPSTALVAPSMTRALGHTDRHRDRHTDRGTGLLLQSGTGHKAMVGCECDMAQWKKIKYFLIHPPSCSRLQQNGSVVLWALLKAQPALGGEGLHIPQEQHSPKPRWVWIQFGSRDSPFPATMHGITSNYKSHVPVGVSASA